MSLMIKNTFRQNIGSVADRVCRMKATRLPGSQFPEPSLSSPTALGLHPVAFWLEWSFFNYIQRSFENNQPHYFPSLLNSDRGHLGRVLVTENTQHLTQRSGK